ncbi:MAG: alkaline phosphatase family protein [Propionibacteriaceae bacterium]|nr:alkaline phosphatase family protein [Propionibacteriaceae bacterium]
MAVFPQSMVLPAYGRGSVSDVLGSVCAHLGVRGADDVLGLPDGDRWVVLLVDGLGDDVLTAAAQTAPFLSGLQASGRVITAGTPSTTVTSITSFGTGLPPGQHGMAGYSFRIHGAGAGRGRGHREQVLNALLWDTPTPAAELQPRATWFERANADGVDASSVSLARFAGSGLTESALRNARFIGIQDESDTERWIATIVSAATGAERTLVYAYERALDHIGHTAGADSPDWLRVLAAIDARAAQLRAALPDDVHLLITADHGMLDVPGRNFLIIEHEPSLSADVRCFAGEGRLRHFYTEHAHAVAARWADRLGDHAWVRTRDDAIDEGWFGVMDDRVRDRFGDVLVAMRTDWAVMTTTQPFELDLVGMHGSLTSVEMNVPLLLARAGA